MTSPPPCACVCVCVCVWSSAAATCVPLIVLQHVDLLGKLAVALLTLVLFDSFVKLHVVPQSMFGLHSWRRSAAEVTWDGEFSRPTERHSPFPHSAHRKSRMSSWTLRCSFSMSFLAKDLLHLSQRWLFTPAPSHNHKQHSGESKGEKPPGGFPQTTTTEREENEKTPPHAAGHMSGMSRGKKEDLPVWMILCRSRLPMLLKIRPQISHGWMYLGHRREPLASFSFKVLIS